MGATSGRVNSSSTDKKNRRVVKSLLTGNEDVQEAPESMPFGIDSNPIKKMTAIYLDTEKEGKKVVIGYLNLNQLAQPGETRLFSKDENGELKMYLWLKADGTLELGGDDDFAVRFTPLKSVIDELKDDIAALKQVFASTWIPVPNDGGAALKAAAATWAGTPLIENIDDAKIEEIKTP